jgi:RND family efflux transporter MFP subunit
MHGQNLHIPARPDPGRARPVNALAIGLLLLLPLASCDAQDSKSVPDQQLVVVEKAVLEPDVLEATGTGEIKPRIETQLAFRVSGRVNARLVNVGDSVKAGQLLATLDDTEQRADIASATASVQAQEASLRIAQSVLTRRQALADSGALSRQQLDSAIQEFRSAQNDLDSAKAGLATAEESLRQTRLLADADGIITERNIEVGQVVQPSTAVFHLAHDGAVDAVFNVQEAVINRNAAPPEIELSLLSRPDVRARAKIREVSPALDRNLGTVRVKLSVQDPPAAMTFGSAILAHVRVESRDRISIPWQALYYADHAPAVWIYDPETKAVSLRNVVVERYDTNTVVLGDGLKSGESYVVQGVQFLRENEIVALAGEAKE